MTSNYIHRFMSLKTAPEVLPWFQTAADPVKEITESMGCWSAAYDILKLNQKNPNVGVLVIGDGKAPITGALFAFMSKWNVISIDPKMGQAAFPCGLPERLLGFGRLFEDIPPDTVAKGLKGCTDNGLLVFPHSHAKLELCINIAKHIFKTFDVIALPCCTKPIRGPLVEKNFALKHSYVSYEDPEILSDKNIVHVWHGVEGEAC